MALIYEEISTQGMNENKTLQPNPTIPLYNVAIQLSKLPHQRWERYFNEAWQSSIGSSDKRAQVEDDCVVIANIALSQVESQMPKLEECVKKANESFKGFVESTNQQERLEATRQLSEANELDALAKRLKKKG